MQNPFRAVSLLVAAMGAAILAAACHEPTSRPGQNTLEGMGYTEIELSPPHSPYDDGCREATYSHTFKGKNLAGNKVHGVLCCEAGRADLVKCTPVW
jgi:hypothetical protein